jgi:hypothetical protein
LGKGKCGNLKSPKSGLEVGSRNLCKEHNVWVIIDSKLINQRIAYNMETHDATCEDGTVYKQNEIKVLFDKTEKGEPMTVDVHVGKKVLEAEVVS